MFCDNYLDGGYHVPYAHKGLASGLKLNSYSTKVCFSHLLLHISFSAFCVLYHVSLTSLKDYFKMSFFFFPDIYHSYYDCCLT